MLKVTLQYNKNSALCDYYDCCDNKFEIKKIHLIALQKTR